MITEFAKSCFGEIHVDKDEAFKQQIKDLFNELIGEDTTIADMEELWARGDEMDITSELHAEGMNMFKVELRREVSDL
jgi:hypothetical protein